MVKIKYKVKIIQRGIPFYDSEEGIGEICFDKNVVTTIGIFDSLQYAKVMKEAVEDEISKSNAYVYSRYAPQVEIYEVHTVEEILNV